MQSEHMQYVFTNITTDENSPCLHIFEYNIYIFHFWKSPLKTKKKMTRPQNGNQFLLNLKLHDFDISSIIVKWTNLQLNV